MRKIFALSLTAMMSLTLVATPSGSANAQGSFQNPLLMGAGTDAIAGTGDDVVKVRSRHSRRRRNKGVAGAIIGGIIAGAIIAEQNRRYHRRPRRRVYRGNVHEDWCYRRFRSYRAWDNTYQPYNGRRRQCISPYY